MRKHLTFYFVLAIVIIVTNSSNCGGDDLKIKYENGFFSDSTVNLININSTYDDINMALPQKFADMQIIFSSNRNSSGGNFDFNSGVMSYVFNQTDGSFVMNTELYSSDFYQYLETATNSTGNEYGPLRIFNGLDGQEYFFFATDDQTTDLNLKFLKYFPTGGINPPAGADIKDVTVLNSSSDDAYLTFDWDFNKVYFNSNRDGNYDIYENPVTISTSFSDWLESGFVASTATANINSPANDKCPFIFDTLMVFTSDRAGGLGGYDLYLSSFSNGQWSAPVNMGPEINTQYNEYRPLLSFASGFTNKFLMFSSDRPGGVGGYDLYFKGFDDL